MHGQLIIQSNRRNLSLQSSNGFRSNTIPGVVYRSLVYLLYYTDLTGSDNGSYSCRADNEANIGAVLTTPYQLTVVERKYKITIIYTITVYYFSFSS